MGKIKNHFSKNKQLYIGLGVGVGVSVVSTLILRQPKVVGTLSKNQVTALLAWKPHQTLEVYIEALGDPGNIIQEVTGGVRGQIWASQNQLARELGVNPARISEYFAGKLSDVQGRNFEILGKAFAK